jgi:acetyl-CoA carboxylase biotin carboxyl carrier protein
VSRKKARKPTKRGTAIVLPGSFAGTKSAQDTAAQHRQIQEMIDLLKRNQLTELEIERAGVRIRVRYEVGVKTVAATVTESGPSTASTFSQATPVSAPVEDASGQITITSPIVGTFYRSPSPDADPYVEEGDYVKKGQVLCIVEAMKLMNEIESEVDGRVTKILVESTKPVEYGQALFLIDPKATP